MKKKYVLRLILRLHHLLLVNKECALFCIAYWQLLSFLDTKYAV